MIGKEHMKHVYIFTFKSDSLPGFITYWFHLTKLVLRYFYLDKIENWFQCNILDNEVAVLNHFKSNTCILLEINK